MRFLSNHANEVSARGGGGHHCGGISVSVWQKGATQQTKLAPNL